MRYGRVVFVCIPFLLSGIYAAEKRKDKKNDGGTMYTNARPSAVYIKKEEKFSQEKKDLHKSAEKAFIHHGFKPVKSKHEGVRTLLRGEKQQNQNKKSSHAKKPANYDIEQIKAILDELVIKSEEAGRNVPPEKKKIWKIVHEGLRKVCQDIVDFNEQSFRGKNKVFIPFISENDGPDPMPHIVTKALVLSTMKNNKKKGPENQNEKDPS